MPDYRFTMGFRLLGRSATETWYKTASNLVAAGLLGEALITARADMLYQETEFVGLRIGLVDVKRNAQLYIPGKYEFETSGLNMVVPKKGTLIKELGVTSSDQPNSCIQIVVRYDTDRSAKRYLAFVPDECVQGDPASVNLDVNQAFLTAYKAYQKLLVGGGWMIRVRDIAGANAEKKIQEWKITDAAPNPLAAFISKEAAPALEVGDKVSIKGVRRKGPDTTSYNGIWRVQAVVTPSGDTQRAIVLKGSDGLDANSIKVNGTLQKVTYKPVAITAWSWFRAGTHKRGGSFGASRGRRLTRRSVVP